MRLWTTAVLATGIAWAALPRAARAQEPVAGSAQGTEELRRLLEEQRALLETQRSEIATLRQRLEQVERQLGTTGAQPEPETQAPQPAAQPAVSAEEQAQALPELTVPHQDLQDFPEAFNIPGTDAKLRIGGQIRTVLVRNLGAVGTDDRFVTSSIPVEGTPEADKTARTTLSASPSRFNFDLRTPTPVGSLRAFIEGDFAGTNRTYRLRHAFGQWRGFIVGQTWSTFSDPEAEPDGIDFEGLNAISLFRQPQIRWTLPLSSRISLAFAIENPSPDITGANGVNQVPDVVARLRFDFPDAGGRFGFLHGGGHIQAAYLLRQIRGEPFDSANQVLSTGGTGYHVSGRLPAPWRRSDYLKFATALGPGIGRYITDLSSAGGQDAVYDAVTVSLRALFANSQYVGYEHWWTNTLRSTATFGFVQVDNLDVQTGDALHQTTRSSFNLSWSPVPRIDLVTEILGGRRVNKDGREGRAGQVQLGWTFRF